MAKREAGWSAIQNPKLAEWAFKAWKRGVPLGIRDLVLARDHAVLHESKAVVNKVNASLRRAVRNVVITSVVRRSYSC